MLVPKSDGEIRLVADFRGLNSLTLKDSFPLPNIDASLATLTNQK